MFELPRSAGYVSTIPSLRKRFMSAGERCFWTYVTEALVSVNKWYINRVLSDGHTELPLPPTEKYKEFEEITSSKS